MPVRAWTTAYLSRHRRVHSCSSGFDRPGWRVKNRRLQRCRLRRTTGKIVGYGGTQLGGVVVNVFKRLDWHASLRLIFIKNAEIPLLAIEPETSDGSPVIVIKNDGEV